MLTTESSALACDVVHKIVQLPRISVQDLPKGACTLEVLKTIESQLLNRGILKAPPGVASAPLWFLAETERNIFLWRNGLSLTQEDDFEFWIDLPKLFEKRLTQLQSYDAENPFMNPLWGNSVQDREHAAKEADYLLYFRDIMMKAESHAHALSRVGSILRNDMSVERKARDMVLLPGKPAAVPEPANR